MKKIKMRSCSLLLNKSQLIASRMSVESDLRQIQAERDQVEVACFGVAITLAGRRNLRRRSI